MLRLFDETFSRKACSTATKILYQLMDLHNQVSVKPIAKHPWHDEIVDRLSHALYQVINYQEYQNQTASIKNTFRIMLAKYLFDQLQPEFSWNIFYHRPLLASHISIFLNKNAPLFSKIKNDDYIPDYYMLTAESIINQEHLKKFFTAKHIVIINSAINNLADELKIIMNIQKFLQLNDFERDALIKCIAYALSLKLNQFDRLALFSNNNLLNSVTLMAFIGPFKKILYPQYAIYGKTLDAKHATEELTTEMADVYPSLFKNDPLCKLIGGYSIGDFSIFNVSIRELNNNPLQEITVNNWERIIDVKVKIRNLKGIPTDQQRLVFSGRQLEDDSMINEYHIKENDRLDLVLRLRGS